MADPNTVNAVAGFETPSTFTSKLDSAGGLVASTLQAQLHVIFSMMYVPEVIGNVAAFARGVPVMGLGRVRRPIERTNAAKARGVRNR